MKSLEELIAEVENFPPLPEIASRVLLELDKPEFEMAAVADLIELDPMLASPLVRLANSALFGRSTPANSVKAAVFRLGAREVRNAVISVTVVQTIPALPESYPASDFWAMSFGSAKLGRRMAVDLRYPVPEEAYLACLLHRCGEAFLASAFPERFEVAVREAHDAALLLEEAVRKEFGCHASELGAEILRVWQIPEPITQAVRFQSAPTHADEFELLSSLIVAADRICTWAGIGPDARAPGPGQLFGDVPLSLHARIEEAGYTALEFYVQALQDEIAEIEGVVATVLG